MNKRLLVVAFALLLVLSNSSTALATFAPTRPSLISKTSIIRVRAFEDVNENKVWDSGELAVYGFSFTYRAPNGSFGSGMTPQVLRARKAGVWKFTNVGDDRWASVSCLVDGKVYSSGLTAPVKALGQRETHSVTFALKKKIVQLPNLYHLDVFYDQNANGTQDAGEPLQGGVRFKATEVETGQIFNSTETSDGSVGLVFPAGTYVIEMLTPTYLQWFNTTGNATYTDYFPGDTSYYNTAGVAFESTVEFASTSWWSVNSEQIKPEAIEYLNKYPQLPGAPYDSADEITIYLGQSEGSLPASMITNVLNAYHYDGSLMKSAMLLDGKWVALQPLFDGAYNAYTTDHDKIGSYVVTYHMLSQYSSQITMPPGYPVTY